MFRRLTRDQLCDLAGRKTRAGVCRWLRESGWIFEPDANGWPIVSDAYAESRLSPQPAMAGSSQPNFGALRKVA